MWGYMVLQTHGLVWFSMNPWIMLTDMLTVDTTTALGQVDMSLCIQVLQTNAQFDIAI